MKCTIPETTTATLPRTGPSGTPHEWGSAMIKPLNKIKFIKDCPFLLDLEWIKVVDMDRMNNRICNVSPVSPGVGVTMTSHNPKCSVSTILSSL